jgi:5-methylcytosine-specific restriction protein B
MHRALGISKEIEDAAWFVLGAGLQGRPSALDGRTQTWTAEAAAELLERLERGSGGRQGTHDDQPAA